MTGITYRRGDATAPNADGSKIVCHVCNDVGGWGKGFVVALHATLVARAVPVFVYDF